MTLDLAAMQILALAATESMDWEHEYRRICRWYSTTFFTPLYDVEMNLPEEYVIRHYFEHTLKTLYDKGQDPDSAAKREDWLKVRENILCLMDDKVKDQVDQRDNEDDTYVEELRQQILKEEKEAKEKAKKVESKQEFEAIPPNLDDEVEFSLSGE